MCVDRQAGRIAMRKPFPPGQGPPETAAPAGRGQEEVGPSFLFGSHGIGQGCKPVAFQQPGKSLIDPSDQSRPLIHKRSEEHTSELQSLMRISYAVFCLKKNKTATTRLHDYEQPSR